MWVPRDFQVLGGGGIEYRIALDAKYNWYIEPNCLKGSRDPNAELTFPPSIPSMREHWTYKHVIQQYKI